MSASSSSKPLNPFATSYEYLNLPRPWCTEVLSNNIVPKSTQSNGIVENRKNSKWRRWSLPPRLRSSARELKFPVKTKQVWVEKSDAKMIKAGSNHVDHHLTAEEQTKFDGKTSVMIKNVPNHIQFDLQRLLDSHCHTENRKAQPGSHFCKSAYDFLYLPMDFGFHLNLGFAFVNFTSPIAALRFYKAFNNREWSFGDNSRKKICEIGIAKYQGKDALKEKFENSVFPCHTNQYLPVVYRPARDGFNRSRPSVIGIRSHKTAATLKDERIMIMTERKNKKLNKFEI